MSDSSINPRPLFWAGYLLAVALVLSPLLNLVLSVWPLQPSNVGWRFGAIGVLSGGLSVALMGMLLLAALTAIADQRVGLRVVAVVSALGALLVVGVVGLFLLDALELRNSIVQYQLRRQFEINSLRALMGYGWAFLVLAALAWGGLRASARPRAARQGARRPEEQPVLVGARAPIAEG